MTDPVAADLEIARVVGGGRCLAHHDGHVWMVAGALPGERVHAVTDLRRHGIVEATAVSVIGPPSADRETHPCPHAPACGGCDWPHVRAQSGAALKREAAAEAARGTPVLARRLRAAEITASPLAYRLRSRLHWDPETGRLGFYRRRSSTVEAIHECRIVSPRLRETVPALATALARSCPVPADVEWLEDLGGATAVAALRPVRRGPALGPSAVPPADAFPGAGPDGFHILRGAGLTGLWGADRVTMDLPVPLDVPIGCFFQGNRHLVPWLFDRIADLVGPEPAPTWDLHAGVGFLAAAALHAAPRPLVLAETFRPSGRAARHNLPSATVRVGRSAEAVLARSRSLPPDALVLVDPPRAGLSVDLRRRLVGRRPRRIVMLACDAATWARDTDDLTDNGYRLTHLELVDLFPSTHHVEIVAALERT